MDSMVIAAVWQGFPDPGLMPPRDGAGAERDDGKTEVAWNRQGRRAAVSEDPHLNLPPEQLANTARPTGL